MEKREDKEDEEVEEDGVCFYKFILKHQHEYQSKVQREPEPGSPPETESEAESGYSGLSFRSDWSKDAFIDFKSGQLLSESRSSGGSDSPLSEHSYPSRGSNRSTNIDLDFNNQRPTPFESFRRTYEELFQRQQEVTRHQKVKLREQEVICHQEVQRQQEVQNLQEVIRHQKDLLHQQEVQRQQEVQNLQEVIRHQKDLLRQQEIQLQAKRKAKQETERELKLKRHEDQLHLKSVKNHSHKAERKPPGLTPSSPTVNISDGFSTLPVCRRKPPYSGVNISDGFSTLPAPRRKPPGSIYSFKKLLDLSFSTSEDEENDQK